MEEADRETLTLTFEQVVTDNQTGVYVDLRDGKSYSFDSAPGKNVNKFSFYSIRDGRSVGTQLNFEDSCLVKITEKELFEDEKTLLEKRRREHTQREKRLHG